MNASIEDTPLQLNLGRWKKELCPQIDNNDIFTNKSLPLDYACSRGP